MNRRVALLALAVGASPAAAQQEPGDAYELGPIVVTAPAAGVVSTMIVSERDIARRGARTLDEALALLPGVAIHTGADGVPRIDVRGLRPRQVRVLVNGVPLNSTYDGQFDPTMIPTEDIAAVTLTTAASSVLYGGGGEVGGVINIQTRRGAGALRVTQADAEAGSGDALRASLGAGGGSRTLDAFVSASSTRRDGFPVSSDERENSFRRREAVYANLGYRPSAAWRLGAALNHVAGGQGIPPSAISDPTDPFANAPRYERLPWQRSDAGQLAAAFTPPGALQVRGWAYGTDAAEDDNRYDDATYTSMDDSTVRGTFRLHSTLDIAGVHLEPRRSLGGAGTIALAVDWERNRWNQTGVIRDVAVGGGGGGGGRGGGAGGGGAATFYRVRSIDQQRLVRSGGAGIEYTGAPLARLGITAGYRTQWQSPFGLTTQRADIAMLGARYDMGARTRLRAAAARRVRFPSIRQLYDAGTGDSTLAPERANTLELGIERSLGSRTAVGVTLFQNDVYDYIEVDEITRRSANFPHYRFRGVEVAAETAPWTLLQLRLGYAYLHARDLSPGAETTALQYRPRHRATLDATLRPGAGFTGSVSIHYAGGQQYFSRTLPLLGAALPDYTVVDSRWSRDFSRPRVSLYLGVRNLLDRRYETSYGFPEPGRIWYGGAALAP